MHLQVLEQRFLQNSRSPGVVDLLNISDFLLGFLMDPQQVIG